MPDVADVDRRNRAIAIWLLITAAAVVVIMVIGAITRLTGSGLSMTEWRPLFGILPPLSQAEWERVFDLYRQTSQYRLQNFGMSLEEFRPIFWWEYVHRVWGRLIGLIFLIPFVVFLLLGWIDRVLGLRLFGLLVLGGLQGVVGWWMVTSGFVDRVEVSQYRLAIHLGLAFLILALLIWQALLLLEGDVEGEPAGTGLRRFAWLLMVMASVTIIAGAFVAGIRAGLVYNEFPLMGGSFVPHAYGHLDPLWLNAFENPAAVQFNHRWLGVLTVLLALLFWLAARTAPLTARARRVVVLVPVLAVVQLALGIATLLMAVPVALGALHQAGAVLLFCAVLRSVFVLRRGIVPIGHGRAGSAPARVVRA